MASVSFIETWIAPVSDLSAQIDVSAASITSLSAVRGRFGETASGRTRLITRAGTVDGVRILSTLVTQAVRTGLEALKGELCQYRDCDGRLLYGSFLEVEAARVKGNLGYCKIGLDFQSVTHSIEV